MVMTYGRCSCVEVNESKPVMSCGEEVVMNLGLVNLVVMKTSGVDGGKGAQGNGYTGNDNYNWRGRGRGSGSGRGIGVSWFSHTVFCLSNFLIFFPRAAMVVIMCWCYVGTPSFVGSVFRDFIIAPSCVGKFRFVRKYCRRPADTVAVVVEWGQAGGESHTAVHGGL
jgi:hypothetical protein